MVKLRHRIYQKENLIRLMVIGTKELTAGDSWLQKKGKGKDSRSEGERMNPLFLKATEETNSVYTLT